MDREAFRALAADLKPLIGEMEEVLKAHGVETLAGLSLSTDGYFSFSPGLPGMYFARNRHGSAAEIRITEEL